MANVIIKQILLAEPDDQRACFLSFSDGTNVLTSNGNSKGKTSLSKFILRSLGSDPSMSDKWNNHVEKVFSKIDLKTGDDNFSIMRFSHYYRVCKNGLLVGSFSTQKDYQELLPKIFGFSIKIKDKNSDSFLSATPSLYLLPNYLPQLHSDDPYRSIFSDLKRFDLSSIIDSLYFQTGALDGGYNEALAKLTKSQKELAEAKEFLTSLKQDQIFVSKKLDSFKNVFSPLAAVRPNTDIVSKVAACKDEIYSLQKEVFDKKHEISMLSKSQQCNDDVLSKMDDKESIICPHCGYELNSLFRDILSIKLSNEAIVKQIGYVKSELLKLEERLKKEQAKLKVLQPIYEETIAARSNSNIGDAVVYWSGEYSRIIADTDKEERILKPTQDSIGVASETISSFRAKKEKSLSKYRDLYRDIILSCGVGSQNMPSFSSLRLMERITFEGSEVSRSDVASFFAFAECKESAFIRMPLLLDFPNNDLNPSNLILSFGVMMSELEKKLSHQIFIFSINAEERASLSGHPFPQNTKIISFESRDQLLTNADYFAHIDDIKELITSF